MRPAPPDHAASGPAHPAAGGREGLPGLRRGPGVREEDRQGVRPGEEDEDGDGGQERGANQG